MAAHLEEFQGTIGRTYQESTPWYPEDRHPGDDAPNVVVVLIDDMGFAQLGCYGSTIETPNIDRLAAGGLRYTNFHVTPVCSPTRAALLTGRNPHAVGMRQVANFNTGFPNMRGRITRHAATMGEVLGDGGYATFAVGKWHLTPTEEASAAGPHRDWPCQRGFDRFYGFLDGETDQFYPELVYDNHPISPPATPEEGYHLSEDLVDHAIEFIHDSKGVRPDRPFFLYLAFGATHSPHQAPAEYLEKYRGRFDHGWDAAREQWFRRQVESGLISPDVELAPRNPGVKPWEELTDNEKALACRLQEAFAAFLDHTDAQVGRLVADLEAMGQLDNTILLVLADNGASQEGGPTGVLHEMLYFNGVPEDPDKAVSRLDDIGTPRSHCNYPWGWAQAGNTPFRWYKQNTHEGGVHVPLIVHWPATVADPGGVRRQFHSVNDLAPTVYELVGVAPPDTFNGYEQLPISGTSLAYSITDPDVSTRKKVQFFESSGHRAIWVDGWKAVTRHRPGDSYDDDVWELYHVDEDPSECRNLADEMPDRVAEMVESWWKEAETHGALPLDDRGVELFRVRPNRRSPHSVDGRYSYRLPLSPIPPAAGPGFGGGGGFKVIAEVDRPAGTGGVLYASGTVNAGFSLFVKDERLVFDYNAFGEHTIVTSPGPLPVGGSRLSVEFRRSGRQAVASLVVNGDQVAAVDVPFAMRMMSSSGSSVGSDHGSPVSDQYEGSFPFEGSLLRLEVETIRRPGSDDAQARYRAEMIRQ